MSKNGLWKTRRKPMPKTLLKKIPISEEDLTFSQGADRKNGHDARRFLQIGFSSGEEGRKWK